MRAASIFLTTIAFWAFSCRPAIPDTLPLDTRICVSTQHHGQPIPQATVYLKYNTDTFPGYDRPAAYFDASFKTGANAHGCIEPVPEGRHWLVAFGYDSLHYPYHVFGSMIVDISVASNPMVDTILYVTE